MTELGKRLRISHNAASIGDSRGKKIVKELSAEERSRRGQKQAGSAEAGGVRSKLLTNCFG